jgi:hypothetical protein
MLIDLKVWLDHFQYHAGQRCVLPGRTRQALTASDRRLIASSIASFQRREQSKGEWLIRAARRYQRVHEAAPLARIVSLIVAEERHHAALLGGFMDQHGIPEKPAGWADKLIHRLRRAAGFELHIGALMTSELIGKVYYRALESATGSRQLQVLCRMLVADELAHVGFESDLWRAMNERRSPTARVAAEAALRALFTSAAFIIWIKHRRVLRAAGYDMTGFMRACAAQFAFYLEPPPVRGASVATSGLTALEENGALCTPRTAA